MFKLGSRVGEILDRETQERISVATFVDHYLRTLHFPSDVLEPLSKGGGVCLRLSNPRESWQRG